MPTKRASVITNEGESRLNELHRTAEIWISSGRDPYVLSGIRSYELRTWGLSHEGNRHMGIAAD